MPSLVSNGCLLPKYGVYTRCEFVYVHPYPSYQIYSGSREMGNNVHWPLFCLRWTHSTYLLKTHTSCEENAFSLLQVILCK